MGWKPLEQRDDQDRSGAAVQKARFLVDENLGEDVARLLRSWGRNAKYLSELGLVGRSDEQVLKFVKLSGKSRLKFLFVTHVPEISSIAGSGFPEAVHPS